MKQIILCFLSLFIPLCLVYGQLPPDPPAIHGMLIFGNKDSGVYAYHLAMYHVPHQYQLLMEIELPTELDGIWDNAWNTSSNKLFTLVPTERFALPDMVNEKLSFNANIVSGHFERGGTVIDGLVNIPVDPARIIIWKNLLSKPGLRFPEFHIVPEQANHKRAKSHFIIHRLNAVVPDYDQIIYVTPGAAQQIYFEEDELKRP